MSSLITTSQEVRLEQDTNNSCLDKRRSRMLTVIVLILGIILAGYLTRYLGHSASEDSSDIFLDDISSVPCKSPLTHSLKNILLAINFNHPFYRNIDVIVEYYQVIFPNYVICGPVKDPRKKHDIIVISNKYKQRGYFGFQCLPEAVKKHPGFTGYLYVNDDMLINWWNLLELDQSKIWFGCDIKFKNAIRIGAPPHNDWWKRADSAEQCTKAFLEVEKNLANNRMLEIYNKNSDGEKVCFSCWSDIFYIPAHLSLFFSRFGDVFFKYKVFLEASVPTIMAFLEYREKYVRLEGIYLPDKYGATINYNDASLDSPIWQEYSRKMVFLHPYKLYGKAKYSRTNLANFKQIMLNYSQQAIRYHCLDNVLYEKKDSLGILRY